MQAADELEILISKSTKNLALEKLMHLMVGTLSGVFKDSLDGRVSISNTYTAVEMLTTMVDVNEATIFLGEIFDKILSLVPNGGNDFEVDPTLIVVLSKARDKKLRLLPAGLLIITESLLSLTLVDDINIVTRAVEGLHILSTYKSAPVHVSLLRQAFVQEPSYELELVVVDIFGKVQKLVDVEVSSVKNIEKDSVILQNTHFESDVIRLPADVISSGRYSANFILTIEGRQKSVVANNLFVVTEQIAVSDISIGVADGSTSKFDLIKITGNNKLPSVVGSALNSEFLYVGFFLKSQRNDKIKRPHQSFISLTNSETGKVSVFIARRQETDFGNTSAFEARVSLKDESVRLSSVSGVYSIAIFVADFSFESAVKVKIGTIDIKFPVLQSLSLPLYTKSLLHTSDTTLKSLPEIVHLMRPDAKKASQLMSSIFTFLTLIPLIGFIVFVLTLHLSFRLTSFSSGLFVICFISALTLYIGYWLALDGVSFYQTIKYLSVVFPVTIVIGRYSLNSVSSLRVASVNNDKEK
jgi:hypothetical protein